MMKPTEMASNAEANDILTAAEIAAMWSHLSGTLSHVEETMLEVLHGLFDLACTERDEAYKLVAFYQGEGEDEIKEETEWQKLARLSKKTPKQRARLAELATFLINELDTQKLRTERNELRAKLADQATIMADLNDGYEALKLELEKANLPLKQGR